MTPKALSREIKFRAWDIKRNRMFPIHTLALRKSDGSIGATFTHEGLFSVDEETGEKNQVTYLDDFVLTQYTGLHDKNGKEIYEGDIVKWVYIQALHTSDVFFIDGGFYCNTNGFIKDLVEWQNLGLITTLGCEVIGNIYENSNLLE